MKKILASLLCAACLAFAGSASAAVQEFGPADWRFTVDVPEGWTATAKDNGVQLTKNDQSTSFQVDVNPTEGKSAKELIDAMAKATGFTPSQEGEAWVLSGESDGVKINVVVNVNEAAGKFSAITLAGTDTDGMGKILSSLKVVNK
ncbi:MAG: hypothetical protein J5600_00530 [Desulfovibrio sp.]|nr:hypothetical protein [Desulfovibrio sp.]